MARLAALETRRDFLRVRGGPRCATGAFVLEARPREGEGADGPPRFGFTVTKAIGTAVVRNRVRRRLREAVRLLAEREARRGHDYVLIARGEARERAFALLTKDLERAFQQVHHAPRKRTRPAGPEQKPQDGSRRPRRNGR